ncbi:hypothetical protein PSHT_11975 [Puccinia striiformis]|uniref:Peptidase A2 domain-containing protein n=1 Tax=Puccinia striiformis TaxID=27350 RepID=A0A2S4UZT7_9BASI|nr:hypothetical protein PSHT_11975 [Puccinia striiformis]
MVKKTSSKENSKKSVKIEDPATTEQLEEKIAKLTTALDYQKRAAPPQLADHHPQVYPYATDFRQFRGEKQSTSASVEVEEWGSWVPPQVHMDEDEAENNLGFGIRKSQRIQEKNPATSNLPTTTTSLDKVKTVKAQVPGSKDEANKLDKSIRNKFAKQTYTLTLEEILKISPQFLSGLQDSLLEEQALENGLNGMVDMTVNKIKIRTLVDTGAEMNIIPDTIANQLGLVTTELFMRLKGIGGHFTPIIGLAENVPISVFPGYIHLANFFIVKGSVHTVLGRPFLADHNVRLELSNQKGEVLSFQDTDDRRLCIPICLPSTPGWQKEPPKLRKNVHYK